MSGNYKYQIKFQVWQVYTRNVQKITEILKIKINFIAYFVCRSR